MRNIILLGQIVDEIRDRIPMRENHHATAESRTGQLGSGNTICLHGNIDHSVNIRQTAAVTAGLPLQLRPAYPLQIAAFQIFDETQNIVVGSRCPV